MANQFDSSTDSVPHPSPASGGAGCGWQDLVPRPYFDPATVVTRSASGEVVSRYGFDSWDFRAQSMDGSTAHTLYFWRAPQDVTNYALLGRIYEQHKGLLWIIADRGDIKTYHTLNRYNTVAQDFCTIACHKGIDLFTLLNDVDEVVALLDEMNGNELSATSALVQAVWRYRRELFLSSAKMQRDKIIEKIRAAQAALPESKQTPLIPSRIYCSILAGLLGGLDAIEHDLDKVLNALRTSLEATAAIKKRMPQVTAQQKAQARGSALAETIELMRPLGWKEGPSKSLHTFILGKLSGYQTHLMHTVAAFSGMRLGEAKLLPLDRVLETFQHRGRIHYVINGYTYKLHRGMKKSTEWITIEHGHRAIKLAIRIAKAVLSLRGEKPKKGQEPLLFPSTGNPFRMMSNTAFFYGQRRLIDAICPKITADDITELNRLELERGWDRNRIEVGKRWPLAMHQLRRSLSVYAHRSGMVSLPALKAQLQHITDEMRAYYADGWSRAVNLVFEKDHFSNEWNTAKTESTYFGLTGALKIAFNEEDDLLGLGAERMEQIVSGRSRQQTLALIKNGTIAYRETVLGGCVSTEECKAMPLAPINFECVESNCVNLVVRGKRLDLVIRSQESVVAKLNNDAKGYVEHRLEAEHLKRMLLARDRLRHAKTKQDAV